MTTTCQSPREVLGLRWQDVDLDDRPRLRIRQTRIPVAGSGIVVSEPKTSRGRRTLPLDPHLAGVLDEFRRRRAQEAALLGREVEAWDYVFVDQLGQPVDPEMYTKSFKALVRRAWLRPIRLHDVRHTALTLMALNEVPMAVVAAWAGHADPAFTLRVYAHSQDDAIREASNLIRMVRE